MFGDAAGTSRPSPSVSLRERTRAVAVGGDSRDGSTMTKLRVADEHRCPPTLRAKEMDL